MKSSIHPNQIKHSKMNLLVLLPITVILGYICGLCSLYSGIISSETTFRAVIHFEIIKKILIILLVLLLSFLKRDNVLIKIITAILSLNLIVFFSTLFQKLNIPYSAGVSSFSLNTVIISSSGGAVFSLFLLFLFFKWQRLILNWKIRGGVSILGIFWIFLFIII